MSPPSAETQDRPKFLRDVGHERMEQPQKSGENEIHHRQNRFLPRLVVAENFRLRRFDEPIAIIAPEKIVESLGDLVEFVFAIRRFGRDQQFIETRQHFDRVDRKRVFLQTRRRLARPVHLAKARGVPKLGREIAALLDLLLIERDVLPARRDPHQAKAQTVRAILRDQIERIGRIAQRFRHLAALLVANESREKNIAKRDVVFEPIGSCPA